MQRILFAALIPFFLFANLKDEYASLETDLEFIIDGKVNAISGAFIDIHNDLEIPSIFPLSVTRASIPLTYKNGNFWEGWHINYTGTCESIYRDKLDYQAEVRDDNGTPLYFNTPYKNRGSYTGIGSWYAKGETNLGRGAIGGKTCIRNYQIYIEKQQQFVTLKTGSGVLKKFKRKLSNENHVWHDFERLDNPSGFSIDVVNRSPTQSIKRCYSADSQEMGHIIMDHGAPHESFRLNPKIFLYANDGRHIEYYFKIHYRI